MTKQRRFTPEDDRLIVTMHELKHASWATIAARLQRKANVIANRYRLLTGSRSDARIKSLADIDAERRARSIAKQSAERDARFAARDARDEAAFRRGDVTAQFFGDPPPGYSALDRKRAGKRA